MLFLFIVLKLFSKNILRFFSFDSSLISELENECIPKYAVESFKISNSNKSFSFTFLSFLYLDLKYFLIVLMSWELIIKGFFIPLNFILNSFTCP